ncbi:MAG: hypothetical protein Kow0029_01420 [Candidatus Rifleibacteriota bacterium]
MKKLVLFLVLLLITGGGYAMIQTLSLEELAHSSDIVAYGKVVGIKTTGKTPEGVEIVANLIEIVDVLKGQISKGEKIKIKTFAKVEDNVSFTQGQKYLLFLQKADGYYNVTNFVQGCWPVDNEGKFEGMGRGKKIEDVKKAINSTPLKFKPKVPDLQL